MVLNLVKPGLARVDLFQALDRHEGGRHVVLAVRTYDLDVVCDWLADAGMKLLGAWEQDGLPLPKDLAVTCVLTRRDPA